MTHAAFVTRPIKRAGMTKPPSTTVMEVIIGRVREALSREACRTVVRIAAGLGVLVAVAVSFGGCGGDGSEPDAALTATLQGNVASVVASLPTEDPISRFAQLRTWFAIPTLAHAQTAAVGGIRVTANHRGRAVAAATTDARGNFTLRVPDGAITLVFSTDSFTLSTELAVPAQRVIILVVVLQPSHATPVFVRERHIVQTVGGAIRCETGLVEITKPNDQDFVIDGGGEDCIRVAGNCSVHIDPVNISLINCARCIDAGGTAQVTLTTLDGDIRCDAREDGIRAQGNASVTLDARGSPTGGGNIVIQSTGDGGIRVAGTANVTLQAQRDLLVAGEVEGIRADGDAAVELTALRCMIEGDPNAIQVAGNALVDAQGCGELQLSGETP
ncbi:MAG TPA: hypothetical protein VLK82_13690 [Candidatus Tectomicrobia bacterium]|nr:hypothetical protein [Candidatus Tectomicrobia bacterium]